MLHPARNRCDLFFFKKQQQKNRTNKNRPQQHQKHSTQGLHHCMGYFCAKCQLTCECLSWGTRLMDGSRGETGGPISPAMKNHQNIGFLSNTGPDPLKNHKTTRPVFNVGPSSTLKQNVVSLVGGLMPA